MGFDFKDWLTVTPQQHLQHERAILEQAGKPVVPPSAKTKATADLQRQWSDWGVKVFNRLDDPNYQKLITYALLAGATPAIVAQLVKKYIHTGHLPWQS